MYWRKFDCLPAPGSRARCASRVQSPCADLGSRMRRKARAGEQRPGPAGAAVKCAAERSRSRSPAGACANCRARVRAKMERYHARGEPQRVTSGSRASATRTASPRVSPDARILGSVARGAAAESGNIRNAEFMTTSDIFGVIRCMISANTPSRVAMRCGLPDDRVGDHVRRLVRRDDGRHLVVDLRRRDHRRAHQRHVDDREVHALVVELGGRAARERLERRLRGDVGREPRGVASARRSRRR
mgnify:CR=1 FL=1